MKVLIISRGLPTTDNPLHGIFEMDQAKALAKQGHSVVYFAIDLRSVRHLRSFGIHQERSNNIDIYRISVPVGAIPLPVKLKIGQKALLRLYHFYRKKSEKPELIHAHFTEIGFIATALSKAEDIPLVITEHSSLMAQNDIPLNILKYAKKTYNRADIVISVSRILRDNILKQTGIKSEVIHNIIDSSIFSNVKRQSHVGFNFVSVSNLISRKRIDLLIEAFIILNKDFPNTRLEIIGDGKEAEGLKNIVNCSGLSKAITFAGKKSRTEIAKIFETKDCFVLPSKRETFGVVYAEAMMAGLPVIASICGGPEDFVNDNTGILRKFTNKEELAESMKEMILNYNKYNFDEIRDYAIRSFSPEIIASQLTHVYNHLVFGD